MDIRPVLLFGMPRSGTTWLGKVFDSHPETLYRHEPDSLGTLNVMPLLAAVAEIDRYRAIITDFASTLSNHRSPRVTGKLPLFPKSYYSPLTFQTRRLLLMSGKFSARFLGELPVPNLVNLNRPGQLHLVWKSIESLGRLGVIARVLEDCRAVHILRHPCGYAASVLRGEAQGRLGGGVSASEDYGILEMLINTEQGIKHGLSMELMHEIHPVERLAWRWVLFNEKAMDDLENLPGCTQVRYEDLCENPLEEYQRLFEFTDLPWHPQTERFIVQSTGNDSSTYYSVFKDPKKAANSWKDNLAAEDIDRVMRIVEGTRPGILYRAS